MRPNTTLSLMRADHQLLERHLLCGDGKEAAAVLVCSRVPGARLRLLVNKVIPVPHETCGERSASSLNWPTDCIEQAIDIAEPKGHTIILIHSHPTGYPAFSATDDDSDREVIPCIFAAFGDLHGTAVMLPTGTIFGRLYDSEGQQTPIDLVSVGGHDLTFWWRDDISGAPARPMAFTSDMTCELNRLTAVVIGISGTGSPCAEQLSRLGFGKVIGIDYDKVEMKNLNRIMNTTVADALAGRVKVEAFGERVSACRAEPFFEAVDKNVLTRRAVMATAEADVIFCCVDKHMPRMIADRLAAAFLLPLFDVGVAIPTRRVGDGFAIAEVTGRIDYVFPGGSSLADRKVYTSASLQAEALAESDPTSHAQQVKAGYIEDHPEEAPSVISLNMRAASDCVMEFIARAYPFRETANANFARKRFMLAEAIEEFEAESEFTAHPTREGLRNPGRCA